MVGNAWISGKFDGPSYSWLFAASNCTRTGISDFSWFCSTCLWTGRLYQECRTNLGNHRFDCWRTFHYEVSCRWTRLFQCRFGICHCREFRLNDFLYFSVSFLILYPAVPSFTSNGQFYSSFQKGPFCTNLPSVLLVVQCDKSVFLKLWINGKIWQPKAHCCLCITLKASPCALRHAHSIHDFGWRWPPTSIGRLHCQLWASNLE